MILDDTLNEFTFLNSSESSNICALLRNVAFACGLCLTHDSLLQFIFAASLDYEAICASTLSRYRRSDRAQLHIQCQEREVRKLYKILRYSGLNIKSISRV